MWAVAYISEGATIIFRIFRSALVFLIKPKQLQKNRKQKEIKRRERERKLPGPPTCSRTGPAPVLAQPTRGSPCRLPPPASGQEGVCPTRAGTRRPPPPCLPVSSPPRSAQRTPRNLPDRSHSLSCFSPPMHSLPLAPERHRRRRHRCHRFRFFHCRCRLSGKRPTRHHDIHAGPPQCRR